MHNCLAASSSAPQPYSSKLDMAFGLSSVALRLLPPRLSHIQASLIWRSACRQFRAVGTNYNQVVKELRLHFSEKKAMALLYKLEQHTVELVKLSRRIVELSRELKEQREQSQTCLDSAESRLKKSETQMEAKWSQKSE